MMDDQNSLDAVVAQARAAFDAGDAAGACALLAPHRAEGWDSAGFVKLFGAACCVAAQSADGIAALERAAELDPSARSPFNLGRAYELSGSPQEARSCYSRALAIDPAYGQAQERLGVLTAPAAAPVAVTSLADEGRPPQPAAAGQKVPPPVPPVTAAGYRDDSGDEPKRPSGPRTPEQIAIEEWEKEQELKRIRREFIIAGVKYGAAIGAILMVINTIVFDALGDLALLVAGGRGGSILGLLGEIAMAVIVGGIYGGVVGLAVGIRDGGALEGGIAGGLFLVLLGLVTGAAADGPAFLIVNGIIGAMVGALIGFLTSFSIRD